MPIWAFWQNSDSSGLDGLVLPALILNYFGQGAVLLARPEMSHHPFYALVPDWAWYPWFFSHRGYNNSSQA